MSALRPAGGPTVGTATHRSGTLVTTTGSGAHSLPHTLSIVPSGLRAKSVHDKRLVYCDVIVGSLDEEKVVKDVVP